MSTEVATADGDAVRITVRMHLISGDEMVIDIDLAQRIVDLKRRISTFDTQKYGTIPVSRQRIVLLPEFGGHEPYEVFTDARTLASCGLENDTRLELVVFDELTPLTNDDRQRVIALVQARQTAELEQLFGERGGELDLYGKFSAQPIGDAGVAVLMDALTFNVTINKIKLSHNDIGAAGAASIAAALVRNTALTKLDLSNNRVGDDGAAALADALTRNSDVTDLDVSFNQLGDAGTEALASALIYNSHITRVNLFGNKAIYAAGRAALAALKAARPELSMLS